VGEIMPGKLKYDTYHKEFTGAMQHAYAVVKKQGYKLDKDSQWNDVTTGPKKPGKGKTNEYHLKLKGTKKGLHIQVYNTGPKYELNMYIEETDMTDLNKFITLLEEYDCGCDNHGDHEECDDGCECENPEFTERELDEIRIDEISQATRKKMKMAMKRMSKKIQKKRQKAMKKIGMTKDQAAKAAASAARKLIQKKLVKGKSKGQMSNAEKGNLEKRMGTPKIKKKIKMMAKKLVKKVKAAHKAKAKAMKMKSKDDE
jgi:hypothetical protein